MKQRIFAGRGVIFDLDGTLLDTLDDLALSGNHALEKFGFEPVPIASFRYHVGNGLRNMMRRALAASLHEEPQNVEFNEGLVSQMCDAVTAHYAENWSNKTRLYVGIGPLLDELQKRGTPFGICSNKDTPFIREMVKLYFPKVNFVALVGFEAGIPLKPDTTGALLLAEKMRLEPAEVVFVGDTRIDMQTAKRAGMFPVGVSWGFRTGKSCWKTGRVSLPTSRRTFCAASPRSGRILQAGGNVS